MIASTAGFRSQKQSGKREEVLARAGSRSLMWSITLDEITRSWARRLVRPASTKPAPRKADQDSLDAVICALVGVHWLSAPREASIMIGDLTRGYMVAPVSTGVRKRLEEAGRRCGVEAR
ncbi:MAG: DUF429 domain-containing protein [Devosia sp.]|nr:DUF429 domain-containing protein [Devosia sp.]